MAVFRDFSMMSSSSSSFILVKMDTVPAKGRRPGSASYIRICSRFSERRKKPPFLQVKWGKIHFLMTGQKRTRVGPPQTAAPVPQE
ncbi:Ankyrin Repeat And Socs Box Protein 14 [Manis pentadactyla]|nr:Ankyrin Repeat And Socs Box Protein 14 [Manis pentadactyla]